LGHEKSLLTEITQLRAGSEKNYDKGDREAVQQHLAMAEQLTGKMGQLMIAVEDYPDLKSDQTMIQAMQTYNEVEAQIAAARRFFNSAVTSLNSSVQIFPGNIIAGWAGVSEMPFYEAEEASKAPVDADNYLT
jgi:LemA protein